MMLHADNNEARVLIVDDKRSARQGLKAFLARIPEIAVVGEAANGLEAVDLTAVHHPDVVLMDVQMSPVDGLEATRRIKSQWPEISIIILTLHLYITGKRCRLGPMLFY